MARKVKATPDSAPAAKPAAGADDLSILAPDDDLTIGGEKIEVREYRFFEGLRLQVHPTFASWFEDLYALLATEAHAPTFDDVLALVGKHEQAVAELVAVCIDRPVEWVQKLGEADGDALLLTWWQVNSGFFVRRVMRRALAKRFENSGSDGRGSTTA